MIIANMATYPARSDIIEDTLSNIHDQVDHLNLCLNAYQRVPPFLRNFENVFPYLPAEDYKDVGKFVFASTPKDTIFLLDDDLEYAPNYVEHMLRIATPKRLQRSVFGVHGINYTRNLEGTIIREKPSRLFNKAFPSTLGVDQLGTGTVVLSGQHMPHLNYMRGSQKFVDVRLARWLHAKGVTLWSVRRDENLIISRIPKEAPSIWSEFTSKPQPNVEQEISEFACSANNIHRALKPYESRKGLSEE